MTRRNKIMACQDAAPCTMLRRLRRLFPRCDHAKNHIKSADCEQPCICYSHLSSMGEENSACISVEPFNEESNSPLFASKMRKEEKS